MLSTNGKMFLLQKKCVIQQNCQFLIHKYDISEIAQIQLEQMQDAMNSSAKSSFVPVMPPKIVW